MESGFGLTLTIQCSDGQLRLSTNVICENLNDLNKMSIILPWTVTVEDYIQEIVGLGLSGLQQAKEKSAGLVPDPVYGDVLLDLPLAEIVDDGDKENVNEEEDCNDDLKMETVAEGVVSMKGDEQPTLEDVGSGDEDLSKLLYDDMNDGEGGEGEIQPDGEEYLDDDDEDYQPTKKSRKAIDTRRVGRKYEVGKDEDRTVGSSFKSSPHSSDDEIATSDISLDIYRAKCEQEPDDEGLFPCHLCGLKYKSNALLLKHIYRHNALKYECSTCHRRFHNKEKLDQHIVVHDSGRKFQCTRCTNSYDKKSHMMRHLYQHVAVKVPSEDSTYKCEICDSGVFNNLSFFNSHLVNHEMQNVMSKQRSVARPSISQYSCDICEKQFRRKDVYDKHVATHANQFFKCMHCSKSYSSKKRLASHLITHKTGVEGEMADAESDNANVVADHQCYICGIDFDDVEDFNKHLVNHEISDVYHDETDTREIHGCHICGLQFKTRQQLSVHISKHDKFSFACDVCHMRFRNKVDCDKHMVKHSSNRRFKCTQCPNSYEKRRLFIKHLHTHFKVKNKKRGDDSTVPESYQCSTCGCEFTDQVLFNNHMVNHEMMTIEAKQNSESDKSTKIRYCSFDDCHRYFLTLAELEDHVAANHDGCPICGKHFVSRLRLKRHLDLHKKKANVTGTSVDAGPESSEVLSTATEVDVGKQANNYPCSLCRKSYSQPSELHKHCQRVHHKPFKCPGHCDRMFGTRMQVRHHVMEFSNIRPYSCEVCGKQFTIKQRYDVHMTVHSGYKPYQCTTCGACFPENQRLKKHMITHSTERNFICETCDKTFKTQTALQLHSRRHLSDRPHICMKCRKGFICQSHLYRHIKESCNPVVHK